MTINYITHDFNQIKKIIVRNLECGKVAVHSECRAEREEDEFSKPFINY